MGDYFSIQRVTSALPKVAGYLPATLELVAISLIIGVLMGILLAYVRMFRVPVASQIAAVYISFVRAMPEIVLLFIVYYGVPLLSGAFGVDLSDSQPFAFAAIAFGINQSAFMGELFCGALESIPRGQFEAAYTAGLTVPQTFLRIIVPQAVRLVLPELGVMIVGLFKLTALASAIGVMDVMGRASAIGNASGHSIEAYCAAAIVFIIISSMLELAFWLLQRHGSERKAVIAR